MYFLTLCAAYICFLVVEFIEAAPISETSSVLGGINANRNSLGASAWFGNDGDYIVEFVNQSGEDLELVVWGPAASWVTVCQPFITDSLSKASHVQISVASGTSGGWAALYPDTCLVGGQISNTWGEFTFDGQYSTFDVSRLVNMSGHGMSIQGADCRSDMQTCVFECLSDDSCEYGYELINCESDSQEGAQHGSWNGSDSGGCLVGSSSSHVEVTFL